MPCPPPVCGEGWIATTEGASSAGYVLMECAGASALETVSVVWFVDTSKGKRVGVTTRNGGFTHHAGAANIKLNLTYRHLGVPALLLALFAIAAVGCGKGPSEITVSTLGARIVGPVRHGDTNREGPTDRDRPSGQPRPGRRRSPACTHPLWELWGQSRRSPLSPRGSCGWQVDDAGGRHHYRASRREPQRQSSQVLPRNTYLYVMREHRAGIAAHRMRTP